MPAVTQPLDCWEELWTLMVIEICRTLSSAERKKAETDLCERLLSALARRVDHFKSMPNVSLFVVAAGGQIHRTPSLAPEDTCPATAAAAALP
ncbi:Protein SOSEKI 1 [Sporothrix eucalyptigena]|uniref:Protein SOSEKI 1 n=1 Tax=Sporothrix eucalyptigena TaxID=1812306 RepID=A0ABP0AP97_9PEZI